MSAVRRPALCFWAVTAASSASLMATPTLAQAGSWAPVLTLYREESDAQDCAIFDALSKQRGWKAVEVPVPLKASVAVGSEFERFRRELRLSPAATAARAA